MLCAPHPHGSKGADPSGVRIGFTVTKKLGGAVVRNRLRRRLRAAARAVFPAHAKPGHDYVVIARSALGDMPFEAITRDLLLALRQL